jgi:phosphoglycerol transferase
LSRLDVIAAAALMLACFVSWCSANSKWTTANWVLPTTYAHDAERGDFLPNVAYLKASSHWAGIPFLWKTVPELGAPYDANWNDVPSLDELVLTLQLALSWLLGLYAGINASFVVAHASAAVAFYAAARLSNVNRLWSWMGALAFGLAPFMFAQSPHHFQVAFIWPVAFFPMVWKAASTGSIPLAKSWRFWGVLAIGFIAGLHFVYYTNVFCQLVLLGAAIQWYRTRETGPLKAALAVIAAAAVGFAVNNVDGWTYRLFHEPNSGAFVREYKWLEIYGLKLVDLVIPPVTHRSDALAAFAINHRKGAPLLDEGGSYLGIVGLLALAWLIVDAVRSGLRGRFNEVPIEAWWILWIVLMFTTGGLNAIAGAFGVTMFRAACRYSVVILAISLLYAARRLTDIQADSAARSTDGTQGILWGTIAAVLGITILWDQVPRAPSAEYTNAINVLVDSDRRFVAQMEATLPDGAMVFQFPVMEYPESPVPGVGSYEHFRPYLYSSKLRYSFGSQKGREREAWQKEVANMPIEKALPEIARRGFAAIYINRRGFQDGGKALEDAIREQGYTKPLIRSPAGDLDCIPLEKQ